MSKVIFVMGYPASGKTTETQDIVDSGFERLNRDSLGAKVPLKALLPKLDEHLKNGKDVVLDNLFTNKEVRKPFIEIAKKHGAEIDCHLMETSFENAQFNACMRMVKKYGRLLNPDEMKRTDNPNMFGPVVIYNYRKHFEAPDLDEGFDTIIKIPFERTFSDEYTNEAIIFDYDDTLRRTVKGNGKFPLKKNQIQLLPQRIDKINRLLKNGVRLLGASNQSGVASGLISNKEVDELFKHTNKLLKNKIEYMFCPHQPVPVSCWCRKPSTGMGAHFVEKYKLLPSKVTMVGDQTSDKTFAKRCGFKFVYAKDFF